MQPDLKKYFLENFTEMNFIHLLCPIMLQNLEESLHGILRYKLLYFTSVPYHAAKHFLKNFGVDAEI